MNVSGPTYKKITPSIDKLSLPVVPRPQCNHMVGNVVYDKTVHSVPKKQNLFGHGIILTKLRVGRPWGLPELPNFEHVGTSLPNCLRTVRRPLLIVIYYRVSRNKFFIDSKHH